VIWSGYDGTNGIFIQDCPLIHPPPEIAQQGNAAILNYFREREQQGTDTLYEAKMLVVGEGGSGKTSLIRRLYQTDLPLPPKEDTTKGIDIHRHDFRMPNGKDFRLNVWDFGGQEIYHATHQFFLTKRSLYILLDNSRSDHKTVHDEGFRYWLEVIDNLSEHSPVLIFQNMDGGRSKEVDMPGIKGQFDNVKEIYRGDLLHDRDSVRPLREAVEFYVKNLPHIGEQLPKKWIDIRHDLEVRAEQDAYISQDDYFKIYEKHLPFDRDKALWLSRYLHDLGVFLHFQDEPALRKTVVLQNQWATEAVFKVLDDEQVKAARGRFTLADCDRIWAASTYADMHGELLALMVKFELCYQLRDTQPGPDAWLTPGLLSASKPDTLRDWAQPGDLVLRYHYTTFKPKGLPNRLMVRMNRYVQDISRAWRNGAYFQDSGNELLVEEPYNTSEIVLRARGKDPKALLTLIAADLDALNSGFGSLREKVKKKIPCICSVCKTRVNPHFYDYDNLLYRRERGKRTAECDISFEEVSVAGLLEGVFSKKNQHTQNQEDMPTPTRPLRAFFSYSKSDKALLEDFKKATAALRRQNLLEAWDDSHIVAGDEWDDEIKTALREADIIFLLLSQDFLATDYIWDEEIKEAMRRHEAREARVVPILLRPCDWKGMPFEKLQGLPRKGRYIASAPNADELWLEVAQGVRAVIEDFWKG
jgi:internalin A